MPLRFGILVFPNVQQLDLTGPYEVFASARDTEVHLVWKDREPLLASTRLSLTPTATFADCPVLDVLCIPGGGGVNVLLRDDIVLGFVREQAAKARYVTSVCTGSLVLGAAGLLQGKRATTHWNAHDFLGRFGAIPVDERIVQDGNLITAGGVTSGIDFGLAVIAELMGQAEAEIVQLSLEYAPQPPFHSGTPKEASPAVLAETRRRLAGSRAAREEILSHW
ncbi:cyclohexyl-isocyanide hydratase [Bosea sp. BE125]|uniref:DJ-1/PfpI family protein n=1 Tax=Bosea sp. BE125 TaxID=2817909 RepID=UPI00285B7DC7|nr:DJ-1/PfpI family protein [Bosea sp. BE125]MDR6870560.1 cyclohexyl-isocyanide hydratase [Bosea sp. BE125]